MSPGHPKTGTPRCPIRSQTPERGFPRSLRGLLGTLKTATGRVGTPKGRAPRGALRRTVPPRAPTRFTVGQFPEHARTAPGHDAHSAPRVWWEGGGIPVHTAPRTMVAILSRGIHPSPPPWVDLSITPHAEQERWSARRCVCGGEGPWGSNRQ